MAYTKIAEFFLVGFGINNIYQQLKIHDVRSCLFGQLHYNYNNRLKKALQDHNYSKVSLFDEQILKAKYPEATCDIWHTPLLPENNIPNTEHHQPVTEMPVLVEDHELSAENNQTMRQCLNMKQLMCM